MTRPRSRLRQVLAFLGVVALALAAVVAGPLTEVHATSGASPASTHPAGIPHRTAAAAHAAGASHRTPARTAASSSVEVFVGYPTTCGRIRTTSRPPGRAPRA